MVSKVWQITHVGEPENVYLEGRDHIGNSRKWEDNIKINVKGTGRGDLDCNHLAYDRVQWRSLVNTAINTRIPFKGGMFFD
jgi:hypothetical protein